MPIKTPTYLNALALNVVKWTSTWAGTTWAITINAEAFAITTDSLTGAVTTLHTLTITNNTVTADSIPYFVIQKWTLTTGVPAITSATVSAGQIVLVIQNIAASWSFNGTLKINWFIINPKGV